MWYENFHEHEKKKKDHIAPKWLFFFFSLKQASVALGEQSSLQSLFSVVPTLPSRASRGMRGEGRPLRLCPRLSSTGSQVRWHGEGPQAWALPAAQDTVQQPIFPGQGTLCFQQRSVSDHCVNTQYTHLKSVF